MTVEFSMVEVNMLIEVTIHQGTASSQEASPKGQKAGLMGQTRYWHQRGRIF